MVLQDVAFLPSVASFPTHFLKVVVEVNALGPPHVLKVCLWVDKAMFTVRYFRSNNYFTSVKFHVDY